MQNVRDLLPNYARAIAFASHIRKELDEEYKKNDRGSSQICSEIQK